MADGVTSWADATRLLTARPNLAAPRPASAVRRETECRVRKFVMEALLQVKTPLFWAHDEPGCGLHQIRNSVAIFRTTSMEGILRAPQGRACGTAERSMLSPQRLWVGRDRSHGCPSRLH